MSSADALEYERWRKSEKEKETAGKLCQLLIFNLNPMYPLSTECSIVRSALYAAKSSLPKGSPRRVFIQDFAASLNRKQILPNENVDEFHKLGYEYMEI